MLAVTVREGFDSTFILVLPLPVLILAGSTGHCTKLSVLHVLLDPAFFILNHFFNPFTRASGPPSSNIC